MPRPKILVVWCCHAHSTVTRHLVRAGHIVHGLHMVLGGLRIEIVRLHLPIIRGRIILGIVIMRGGVMAVSIGRPVEGIVLVLVSQRRRRRRRRRDQTRGVAPMGRDVPRGPVGLHLR